jgi:hypothetical protein
MPYESQPTVRALTTRGRERLFGKYKYIAAPTKTNPEGIKIIDQWAKENLVDISLAALPQHEGPNRATFHRLVAPRVEELIKAWKDAGLLEDILSWNGGYNARFIRGSRTSLSAHSWGSAFDINARWNALGKAPAKLGQKGSVLRLVPIAEELGWYWGGRMRARQDGMHFELSRL